MNAEKNLHLLKTDFGHEIEQLVYAGRYGEAYALWGSGMASGRVPLKGNDALTRRVWERVAGAVEKFNEPGKFTALIEFGWASNPGGNDLHSNVAFPQRQSQGRSDPVHFQPHEVAQMKGDSETHPSLSPNDEFAGYGRWDKGSFGPEPKTKDMLPRKNACPALKQGLKPKEMLGVNPFKFGMIGSTNSHTSPATTQENDYFGKARLEGLLPIVAVSRKRSRAFCKSPAVWISPFVTTRPWPPAWAPFGLEPSREFNFDQLAPELKQAFVDDATQGLRLMHAVATSQRHPVNGSSSPTSGIGAYGNEYLQRAAIA